MSLWAVVPVKPFAMAKQRLAEVFDAHERAALAACMLRDVLAALAAVPALAGRLVVTADEDAAALARSLGADVLAEPEPAGLNEAVRAAAAWVQAQGGHAMLVVPGDAPGVTPAEIMRLAEAHAGGAPAAIVPAHDEGGTNALLLALPAPLAPAFGEGSFGRHLRAALTAGLAPHVLRLAGLALDLDQPRDIARFLHAPSPTHSWRWLAVHAADSPASTLPRAGSSADTSRGAPAPATRSHAACQPRAPTAAIS